MDRLVLLYAVILLVSGSSSEEDEPEETGEQNELDSMIEEEYTKGFYQIMLMRFQVN